MEQQSTAPQGPKPRAGGVPGEVWARRNAVERAAARLAQAGALSRTLEQTIRVLAAGAWPCASGRFVNALEARQLADRRGCSRETLRGHVRTLEQAGWVRDVSLSNGGRGVSQGLRFGIDLSPLLDRVGEAEAAWKRRSAELRALDEERARLRQLKGSLRRLATAAAREGRAAAAGAVATLGELPRRFDKLGLDALRRLAAAAAEVIAALADGAGDRGRRKPCDREPEDAGPTNTQNERSSSKGLADEKGANTPCARAREPSTRDREEGAFDLRPAQVLDLLPREMREAVTEIYGQDERTFWQGIDEAARALWCEAGGDARTREGVMQRLGQRQGAVLLLLVRAQAGRGGVRDLGAYAAGCARRASEGAFMWGASARMARTWCRSLEHP